MLLRVIATVNPMIQEHFIRQTYEWFFQKLQAMGALSQVEIEAEIKLLNPNVKQLANQMKQVIDVKLRSALCNVEDLTQA